MYMDRNSIERAIKLLDRSVADPTVVMTNDADEDTIRQAFAIAAYALSKHCDRITVRARVEAAKESFRNAYSMGIKVKFGKKGE